MYLRYLVVRQTDTPPTPLISPTSLLPFLPSSSAFQSASPPRMFSGDQHMHLQRACELLHASRICVACAAPQINKVDECRVGHPISKVRLALYLVRHGTVLSSALRPESHPVLPSTEVGRLEEGWECQNTACKDKELRVKTDSKWNT